MGRLLKKKDPTKRKVQRTGKTENETEATNTIESTSSAKPAPVVKKPVGIIKPKPVVSGEQNFLQKSIQFLREVKIELKKVTWPSRKQTIGSTVVVLVLVFIVSLFLGFVDYGLAKLVRTVLP